MQLQVVELFFAVTQRLIQQIRDHAAGHQAVGRELEDGALLGFGLLADRGDGIAGRGRGNPELPEAPDFPPPITSDAIAAPRAYMDALAASASAGPMIGMLATAEAAFAAMTGVWLTIWDSACAFWMVCAVLPLCYALPLQSQFHAVQT